VFEQIIPFKSGAWEYLNALYVHMRVLCTALALLNQQLAYYGAVC